MSDGGSAQAPLPAPGDRGAARRAPRRSGSGTYVVGNPLQTVNTAAKWLLAIGILQVVMGLLTGLGNSEQADTALQHVRRFEPEEVVRLDDGREMTAAKLRQQIEHERILGYVVPVGFGLALIGLYYWAMRSALPAFITALCLFVLIHGVQGVINPISLVAGLPLKVLVIVALVAGIKAALVERDARSQNVT